MDKLPTNDRSARRAFYASLGLHGALFVVILCTMLFAPPPPPLPHALLVRTVSLRPGPAMRTVAAPRAQGTAKQPASEEKALEKEQPSEGPKIEEADPEPPSPPSPKKSPTPSKNATSTAPSKKGAASSNTTKGKPTAKSSTKKSAPQYDQKLLGEALKRLDRTKSVTAQKGGGSGSGSGSGSGGVSRVGTVGALNVESGLAASEGCEEGTDGYATASPEACYIGDMIRRLQLNVRLPEPGEVRVKLTLKRSGTISSVEILSGSKTSIKQAIEKKLKAVHFSPFGTSFSSESEHTFNLRLSNDLVWSCR